MMLSLDQEIPFGGKPTTLKDELKANGGTRLRLTSHDENSTFYVTFYPSDGYKDFGEQHEISKADYEFLEKEGVIKRFTTENP